MKSGLAHDLARDSLVLKAAGVAEQVADGNQPFAALFPLGVEVGDGLVERFDLTLFDELADGEADDRLGGRHRVNGTSLFAEIPVGDQATVLDDEHGVRALGLGLRLQLFEHGMSMPTAAASRAGRVGRRPGQGSLRER